VPRFLVDAQLPPGLARRLVERGYDALHINDTDLREAADRDIWNFAVLNEYVVITKDVDFVILANLSPKGAPIVWIRLGNVGNARLWKDFEPPLPSIVAKLGHGERLVEVSP
jgi:predicted nuclease of predicted toxin-antitoxin system